MSLLEKDPAHSNVAKQVSSSERPEFFKKLEDLACTPQIEAGVKPSPTGCGSLSYKLRPHFPGSCASLPRVMNDTSGPCGAEKETFSVCDAHLNGEERKSHRTSEPFFLLWCHHGNSHHSKHRLSTRNEAMSRQN